MQSDPKSSATRDSPHPRARSSVQNGIPWYHPPTQRTFFAPGLCVPGTNREAAIRDAGNPPPCEARRRRTRPRCNKRIEVIPPPPPSPLERWAGGPAIHSLIRGHAPRSLVPPTTVRRSAPLRAGSMAGLLLPSRTDHPNRFCTAGVCFNPHSDGGFTSILINRCPASVVVPSDARAGGMARQRHATHRTERARGCMRERGFSAICGGWGVGAPTLLIWKKAQ